MRAWIRAWACVRVHARVRACRYEAGIGCTYRKTPPQVGAGRATDDGVLGEGREEDDVGAAVPAHGSQRRRRERCEGLDPCLRREGKVDCNVRQHNVSLYGPIHCSQRVFQKIFIANAHGGSDLIMTLADDVFKVPDPGSASTV
jgi:hypothetical protein